MISIYVQINVMMDIILIGNNVLNVIQVALHAQDQMIFNVLNVLMKENIIKRMKNKYFAVIKVALNVMATKNLIV